MTVVRRDLFPRHDDFFDLSVFRDRTAHLHWPCHVLPLGSTACIDRGREIAIITRRDNLHLRMPSLEQILDSDATILDLVSDTAFAPVRMELQLGTLSHGTPSRPLVRFEDSVRIAPPELVGVGVLPGFFCGLEMLIP